MTRGAEAPAAGLLLLDKPPGPTSHDIVQQVRRAAHIRRVGHTGTLDPMATGLLVMALGPMTRLVRFLPHEPKHYEGTIRLGVRTDTDDMEGRILERGSEPPPDPEAVVSAARGFLGAGTQRPPAVSAKRRGGVRLYHLARRGAPVQAPPAAVTVHRFDLVPHPDDPWRWRFTAEVSSGTYIRALARDLGEALGCHGALESLRRTAIGPFQVAEALSTEDLESPQAWRRAVVAPEAAPIPLPSVRLVGSDAEARFRSGATAPAAALEPVADAGQVRVLTGSGALAGVGLWERGRVSPKVVIPEYR